MVFLVSKAVDSGRGANSDADGEPTAGITGSYSCVANRTRSSSVLVSSRKRAGWGARQRSLLLSRHSKASAIQSSMRSNA